MKNQKQHQLRLMHGGADDDFFFGNNRQRQLTTDSLNEFINGVATVAKRFQSRQCTKAYTTKQSLQVHIEAVHLGIRHRCPNCQSTFSLTASWLDICVRTVHEAISAVDVESAFRSAIDWRKGVAHRGRFGSLFQVVRFVYASVLLLLQLFASADSHSRRSHQQSAIQNHNKESNEDDG
jgi:hypothetical protein